MLSRAKFYVHVPSWSFRLIRKFRGRSIDRESHMAQKTTTKRHENKDSLNLLERGSSSNPATIGDSKFNRQTGALLANRRRCDQIRSWHPRLSASIRGTKPVNAKTPTILLQATGLRTIQPSSNERRRSPMHRQCGFYL